MTSKAATTSPQHVPPPKTASLTRQIIIEMAVAAATGNNKRGSRRSSSSSWRWQKELEHPVHVFFPYHDIHILYWLLFTIRLCMLTCPMTSKAATTSPQHVPPPKMASLTRQIITEMAVAAAGNNKRGPRRAGVFFLIYIYIYIYILY